MGALPCLSIRVMQQTHANAMMGPIILICFSYGTILTNNLDVYHILYTQPIRAGMGTPVNAHTAGPLILLGEPALVALMLDTR